MCPIERIRKLENDTNRIAFKILKITLIMDLNIHQKNLDPFRQVERGGF